MKLHRLFSTSLFILIILFQSCSHTEKTSETQEVRSYIPVTWKLARKHLDNFIKSNTPANTEVIKISPENNYLNFLFSTRKSRYSALPLSSQIAVKVYCTTGQQTLPKEMFPGAVPLNCTVQFPPGENIHTLHTLASYKNEQIYLYFYVGAAEMSNYTQRSPYSIKMENASWTISIKP